jgi:hypothetical protein
MQRRNPLIEESGEEIFPSLLGSLLRIVVSQTNRTPPATCLLSKWNMCSHNSCMLAVARALVQSWKLGFF